MTIWGWGEVLRYFHLYLSSEHYFWLEISEKLYFWEYENLWIFFWWGWGRGSLRNRTFFWGGSFLYILGLFKVKIQNGNIFSAAKFQIFLGMPEGPSQCMKKNWEYLLECLWVQIYITKFLTLCTRIYLFSINAQFVWLYLIWIWARNSIYHIN